MTSDLQRSSSTWARQYLLNLKREYPPKYRLNSIGNDRAQALAGILHEFLPQPLLEMIRDDLIVIGEVGNFIPEMVMYSAPLSERRSFVIAVNSGVMDFYYAVGRAMHGRMILHSNSHQPENTAAVLIESVVENIGNTLVTWKKNCQPSIKDYFLNLFNQTNRRIEHDTFALTKNVIFLTETLVNNAELFMIAHEFGHVALKTDIFNSVYNNDENDADAFALISFLPSVESRMGRRMGLAGMGFAVRLTASLERNGVKVQKIYGSAEKRLERLLSRVRELSPCDQYYDEAATILVSYLDLMDHLDELINLIVLANKPETLEWQGRVRLIAVLEEVTRSRCKVGEFEHMCSMAAQKFSEEEMTRIGSRLVDYYILKPSNQAYIDKALQIKMGVCLAELVSSFSEPLKKYFPI